MTLASEASPEGKLAVQYCGSNVILVSDYWHIR